MALACCSATKCRRGTGATWITTCWSSAIVGEGATELIHIGQAVINLGGTVDFFVNNTFNYPTLAEAYKIAGLDAWNRMGRA